MITQPAEEPNQTPERAAEPTTSQSVSDLTLGEFLHHLVRHPGETLAALNDTLQSIPAPQRESVAEEPLRQHSNTPRANQSLVPAATVLAGDEFVFPPVTMPPSAIHVGTNRTVLVIFALLAVCTMAVFGENALLGSRNVPIENNPLTFPGMLLIAAGLAFAVLVWTQVRFDSLAPLTDQIVDKPLIASMKVIVARYGLRALFLIIALISARLAWYANNVTTFTSEGVTFWIIGIIAITGACFDHLPDLSGLQRDFQNRIQHILHATLRFRLTPTLIAMIAILLIGGWFRFNNLGAYPPDMTSDHVEKARDAFFISQDGYRPIFLDNNGGREPGHFYFIALLQAVTGMPWGFDLLKIASGIWGMMMILVAWWMGRAIVGEEDRSLGNLTGIIMAALVAVSYWHTMLSRLGLRIVSTTVIAGLLLIFLTRALRHNRRPDWILSGLILGAGMYFYQAVRMLPVVVIAGVALAFLVRARSRRSAAAITLNFIALVLVALAVFAPLGRYMIELPQSFWSRSSGRLFGEDTIEIKDDTGNVVGNRLADNQDRLEAFMRNLPVLGANMLKSVWMFNWQGDRAWITGSPEGEPQLDIFTGAMFAIGLGLMVARIGRRRDPSDWLFPLAVIIMVLPTALSIAFIIEVPSATRASGAFPIVYFIAAFGLAMALKIVGDKLNSTAMRQLLVVLAFIAIGVGGAANWHTYFSVAMSYYRESTFPYRQAGEILRGFSESVGSSGNAFMIAYPYWWDHRALAIEAGDVRWNNGVLETQLEQRLLDMIRANVGTPYELRPDRQLLFFLHQDATASLDTLRQIFPDGKVTRIEAYEPARDFLLYTVQPVGCRWIKAQIGLSSICV